MLRFEHNPDKIFTEVLELAFGLGLDTIRETKENDDLQYYCSFFPYASRVFSADKTKEVLSKLIKYNKAQGLWQINDYHYCLIYDSLERFCEIENDLAADSNKPILVVDGVKIWELDFEAIVDIYFFDTDFLIEPDVLQNMPPDKKEQMGFTPETFPVVMGMKPHLDELKIKLIEKGEFKPQDPERSHYEKGSRIYPS